MCSQSTLFSIVILQHPDTFIMALMLKFRHMALIADICFIYVKISICTACAEEALVMLSGAVLGQQSIRLSWGRSLANKQSAGGLSLNNQIQINGMEFIMDMGKGMKLMVMPSASRSAYVHIWCISSIWELSTPGELESEHLCLAPSANGWYYMESKYCSSGDFNYYIVDYKNHTTCVAAEDGESFAEEQSLCFMETSALDSTNIEEAL
eukprot:Gb_19029 [translate_table: standard]